MTERLIGPITVEQFEAGNFRERQTMLKEEILKRGLEFGVRREPETIFGKVMSSAEVNAALQSEDSGLLIKAIGVTVVSDGKKFFFTDDSSYQLKLGAPKWMSCAFRVPMKVIAREGLEDGYIDTAEKLIKVFYSDEEQLSTADEVVQYHNEIYDDFGPN